MSSCAAASPLRLRAAAATIGDKIPDCPNSLDRIAARCFRRGARLCHRRSMKSLISSSSLIIALLWTAILPVNAQVNVTQKNNNLSRDGLYIDAGVYAGQRSQSHSRPELQRHNLRQRSRAAALHRGRPKRPDGHCRDRIEQCLCAPCTIPARVIWSAHRHRPGGNFRSSVRQHQPGWHHWHACCRSRVAIAFLRRIDRWQSQ